MRVFDIICLVYFIIILSSVPPLVNMAYEERQTCSESTTEEGEQ